MSTYTIPEPLSASQLNIEDKVRGNLFTWRGQFSPQLIENLLKFYCADGKSVFDPFGGSGTVLYECALLGKEAHVTELNPAAWILSRTYELATINASERTEAINSVRDFTASRFPIPLFSGDKRELSSHELSVVIGEFNSRNRTLAEQQLFSAIIILLDVYAKSPTPEQIDKVLRKLSNKVMSLPFCEVPIRAYLADARKTPFEAGTFDFVVTSPPYINVFNYHQNYRASTELLGWDLLKIAKSEIGSNRANRANRFLTVAQYCFDIGAVLQELKRICKADAQLILVVGRTSTVLGVAWQNSLIVRRIAEESGYFVCTMVQERKFRSKFGTVIYEDLLHLSPSAKTEGSMRACAERVARDVLQDAIRAGAVKAIPLLREVAEKVGDLQGTTVFTLNGEPNPTFFVRDQIYAPLQGSTSCKTKGMPRE